MSGATAVQVSGGAFGDTGTLTVVVRVGARERGRQGWPIAGFTAGEVTLSAPIGPEGSDVEVEVQSTPDAAYVLRNAVDLVERRGAKRGASALRRGADCAGRRSGGRGGASARAAGGWPPIRAPISARGRR